MLRILAGGQETEYVGKMPQSQEKTQTHNMK